MTILFEFLDSAMQKVNIFLDFILNELGYLALVTQKTLINTTYMIILRFI